jgi:hypothetical protein
MTSPILYTFDDQYYQAFTTPETSDKYVLRCQEEEVDGSRMALFSIEEKKGIWNWLKRNIFFRYQYNRSDVLGKINTIVTTSFKNFVGDRDEQIHFCRAARLLAEKMGNNECAVRIEKLSKRLLPPSGKAPVHEPLVPPQPKKPKPLAVGPKPPVRSHAKKPKAHVAGPKPPARPKPTTVPEPALKAPKAVKAPLAPPKMDLAPKPPIEFTYGYGIQNGGNSCYLDATLQALRSCPQFLIFLKDPPPLPVTEEEFNVACQDRDLPKNAQIISNWIRGQLLHFIDIVKNQKRNFTREEINIFRNGLRQAGFEGGAYTQEDAAQVCDFILENIGVPTFAYYKKVFHELPGRYAALDVTSERPIRGHAILIELDEKQREEDIENLQDRVVASHILEEFEKKNLEVTPSGPSTIPPSMAQEIPKQGMIPTLQTLQLDPQRLPPFLAMNLKRFEYGDLGEHKLANAVNIPQQLVFPTGNAPLDRVTYQLKSVVIHDDYGLGTIHGGHYYTFVPKEEHGRLFWYVYDDSNVFRYADKDFPENYREDLLRNSYVALYEPAQAQPNHGRSKNKGAPSRKRLTT